MTTEEVIIIRKSPWIFIIRVILIVLFFTLLPLVLSILPVIRHGYEQLNISRSISFVVFIALTFAALQILALAVAFAMWYFPYYLLDSVHITHKRATLFADRVLANTDAIHQVHAKQGGVSRRLGYGTLELYKGDKSKKISLKGVPNPEPQAQLVEDYIRRNTHHKQPLLPASVQQIIDSGESQNVEFKSSIMWDYHQEQVNKHLSEPIIKNVSAFMNSTGGIVVIGVNDDGDILGLEADLNVLKKHDLDGFELVFNNAFNQMIGADFHQFIDIKFPEVEGKNICLVRVRPSDRPAYFRSKGKEYFYIRAGNASQPLTVSKATEYIQRHFRK